MTAYNLLSELRQAGVVVKASGTDRLVVDAPKGALTPDLRAALAEHKKELLAILTVTDQRSQLEMELPERAVVAKVPAIVRRETAATSGAVSNSKPNPFSSPVSAHVPDPVEKTLRSPIDIRPDQPAVQSPLKSTFERPVQSSSSTPVTKPVPSQPDSDFDGSPESLEEKIRNLEQEAARLRAAQEARRAEVDARQRIENEIKRLEEEAARLPQEEEARRAEREAVRVAEQERWEAAAAVYKKAAEEAELRRAEEERRATQLEARRHAEEEIARRRAEEEIRKVEEQLASLRAEEVNRRAEVAARWQAEDDRWLAETENRRSADEQAALEFGAAERERQEAEARYSAEDEATRTRAEASLRTIREEIARLRIEQQSYGAAEATRKAEEEAIRKAADEARRRAEEEARFRADEEARQREAEERRLRAEQEARFLAEQEALERAEEEARLRAEEEARQAENEARLRALEEERRSLEEEARAQANAKTAPQLPPQWFPVNLDDREDSRRTESSSNPLILPEVEGMTADSEGSFIEYQEFEPRGLQLHSSAIKQEAEETDGDFQFLENSQENMGGGGTASAVSNTTLDMLASENISERCAAVIALPNLGGEDAFAHISAAFDDPAEEVRTAAARALFNFQADRAAAFTRALREAPPDRRRKIGAAIASSGLASEAIGNLTGESREKTYDAFSLLFLMSKAGEVHPLLRAIEEHANIEVRLAVVKLLALSGQHEILPAFRRLAVRGSLPPEVRSSVMEAIYQISSQASADTPSAA